MGYVRRSVMPFTCVLLLTANALGSSERWLAQAGAPVEDELDLSLDEVGGKKKSEKKLSDSELKEPNQTDFELDPSSYDHVKAVQRKPVLKRLRAEFEPLFGVSLNDSFYTHLVGGAMLTFYPHDSLGLGVRGMFFLAHARSQNHKVLRIAQVAIPAAYELPEWSAMGVATWSPIYGKFALVDKLIIPFDFYFLAGAGVIGVGESIRPGFEAGAGYRIYLDKWLALRFEAVSTVFNDTQTVNGILRSDVQHYLMLNAGVSVFFPPSFEYGRDRR